MKTTAKNILDVKKRREIKRQKNVIIDEIYPLLKELKLTIEESKIFLQVIGVAMQAKLEKMAMEKTVEELGLKEMLSESKDKAKYEKLLDVLGKEFVGKAKGLCDETNQAIEAFVRQENYSRKLSDLKTDWQK